MTLDPILDLLIQAHGETLGRLVCGSYRLAQTAAGHAGGREAAEAELKKIRESVHAPETAQGEVRP